MHSMRFAFSVQEPLQNSSCQKGGIKQVPHPVPTNIRCHMVDLAPRIWAPLLFTIIQMSLPYLETALKIIFSKLLQFATLF